MRHVTSNCGRRLLNLEVATVKKGGFHLAPLLYSYPIGMIYTIHLKLSIQTILAHITSNRVSGSSMHQEVGAYYETFFAGYNLVKNRIFQYSFTSLYITPLGIYHSNISIRIPVKEEIFLFNLCPFLAQGHIMRRFGPFCARIYIISIAFLGSKRQQKRQKYDVMYQTLFRAYRGPDGPSKEKEAYKPSKSVMIKHEGGKVNSLSL